MRSHHARLSILSLVLLWSASAAAEQGNKPPKGVGREPRRSVVASKPARLVPRVVHSKVLSKVGTDRLAIGTALTEQKLRSPLEAATSKLGATGAKSHLAPAKVTPAAARATLKLKLRKTHGPLGDLFFGATAKDLESRKTQIEKAARQQQSFREELARQQTPAELAAFEQRWANRRVPALLRNELLKAYMNKATKDPRSWAPVVRAWETAVRRHPEYRQDEIGREFYIVALNKSGRLLDSVREARQYQRDQTKAAGQPRRSQRRVGSVRPEGRFNGELLAGQGKAFSLLHDQLARGGPVDPAVRKLIVEEHGPSALKPGFNLAKAALDISTRYYEKGFLSDFEYYPGIVAVYNNYQRGDVKRAEQLAPMVWAATQHAGGARTKDYWCLATQVELSLITNRPRDFARLFPRMLEQAKVSWELSSTLDKMKMLLDLRKAKGEPVEHLQYAVGVLDKRVRHLDAQNKALTAVRTKRPERLEAAEAKHRKLTGRWRQAALEGLKTRFGEEAPATVRDTHRARVTQAVLGSSGDFRGMTSTHAIGGNVQYNGQIPDTVVTRHTVRVARELLRDWKLDKVEDFETWNAQINAKLDRLLGLQDQGSNRRPAEDLHSPEHVILNKYDTKRFELAATRASGDSRTDLLAILGLGIGDCRPTAYAKQLFFDVWRRDHVNRLMGRAFDAGLKGRSGEQRRLLAEIDKLERQQLRLMTVEIKAPVQMNKLYEWKTDAQGRPLRDPSNRFNHVENHTFNILVNLDEEGQVTKTTRAVDAFYRQLYPLGDKVMRTSDLLSKGGLRGGYMGVTAADGKPIPFRMVPTFFSGAPIKEFDVGSCDFRFCGQFAAAPGKEALKKHHGRNRKVAVGIAEMEF